VESIKPKENFMSIRKLQEHEIKEVAGGVLPTQYVALDKSITASVATGAIGGVNVGDVAIRCCACHCCKSCGGLVLDLGAAVNPAMR
jgi:hypothetical protein